MNELKELDRLSKIVGSMGTFNEMISCGAKKIALGAPVTDPKERDMHLEYIKPICEARGNKWYKDDDALLTDLFPVSLNKNKHNILFYRHEEDLQAYLGLKERKKALVAAGRYNAVERYKLAYDFGILLSYSDSEIKKMIAKNDELEIIDEPENKFPIRAQISFLYFDDLEKAHKFFKEVLCLPVAADQGEDYCIIYKTSETSFIGAVDKKRGACKATSTDGVLTSLVVKNAEEVYERVKNLEMITDIKPLHISEKLNIKSMMFTGPEGYRFEVEEFLGEKERRFFYNE